MMIVYNNQASIWDTGADSIIIPVNTVGVAGAGLAKQWRQRYPEQYERYRAMCQAGAFQPGEILDLGRIVLVFTKEHYSKPSQFEWIEHILFTLRDYLPKTQKSLALPKIGCGHGKLDWALVNHYIKLYLEKCNVIVYGEDV